MESVAHNLGYRYRHISNADLRQPNGGINSHIGDSWACRSSSDPPVRRESLRRNASRRAERKNNDSAAYGEIAGVNARIPHAVKGHDLESGLWGRGGRSPFEPARDARVFQGELFRDPATHEPLPPDGEPV